MITQKLILALLLFVSAFQPVEYKSNNSKQKSTSYNFQHSIDSLKQIISNFGWDHSTLKLYEEYLANLNVDMINSEKEFIDELPEGFTKSFSYALIEKKLGQYQSMFDTLFNYIDSSVTYFPFYEHLIFSAAATDGLRLLETKIEKSSNVDKKFFPFALSLISSARGEYNSSLEHLNRFKDNNDSEEVLFQYVKIYRNLGDYEKAYSAIKTIFEKYPDNVLVQTKALIAEGALLLLSDKLKEAERIYLKAKIHSQKINSSQLLAASLISLGICDDMYGRLDDARNKFTEAITLADKIGDEDIKALAYSELGVSFSYTNNLIEAKYNYEQSFMHYKNTGNKSRLSFLSDNIGKIYITMYDYRSALKFYEEGLELSAENKRARILNLTGLADIYTNMSNYSKALKYYSEARELAKEIKEVSLDAEIEKGLGSLNYNLDKFSNAVQYFTSASVNSEAAGNIYLSADLFQKLGLTYLNLDSLNLARKYLTDALEVSKRIGDPYTEINSGLSLAYLSLKKKDMNEAFQFIGKVRNTAVQYGFEYELAECDLLAGEINQAANDFDGTTAFYKQALARANKINSFDLMIEANYRLARAYEEKSLDALAESYYSSAAKLIEDRSRSLFEDDEVQISYFTSKHIVFNSYAEFYLRQKKFKEAFELIEKSRSRNTMQNLVNLKLQSEIKDKKELKNIYEYDWIIQSGLYSERQLDSVKFLFNELKTKIVDDDKTIGKYLNLESGTSLKELQKNLEKDEHVVSYFSASELTYAFVVSRDDFAVSELTVSRQQLIKLLSDISPYYETSSTGVYYNQDLFSFNVEAAYNFYSRVTAPVIEKIPEHDNIIFTTSGLLESFPFEFLVTEFNKDQSSYKYTGQKYLLYRNRISYSPSASVYVEQKNNEYKNNNEVLIVGNPSINTSSEGYAERRGLLEESPGLPRNIALLPLKYSLEEVNQIGEVIDADKVLVSSNATETNFKQNAEYAKVIHLSTHSFLFNKQPVIFFSNSYDAENDGFLEASEIVQMKLNSDLVVLSSCISGLGQVDESEGIIGMTKAFFEAGSKSVVVSLWDVNDKYTSKLMGLFYQKLSEGFDKSEALRLAKIDFIKEYSPNPYYWGAFVLAGNTNELTLKAGTNSYTYLIIISLAVVISMLYLAVRKRSVRERNQSVPS
ncbi:MAG: CHAT domain-containing protein [Ignavibacteriales bacterium]|nr:MAG: CHAT domain-containing protein [Ignavibacteriales bacterium]